MESENVEECSMHEVDMEQEKRRRAAEILASKLSEPSMPLRWTDATRTFDSRYSSHRLSQKMRSPALVPWKTASKASGEKQLTSFSVTIAPRFRSTMAAP